MPQCTSQATARSPHRPRCGMSWAPVLFLLGFLAAIGVLALFLLEPLMRIAHEAPPEERKRISAYAALAVCVLILILLVGLVFTIRMGRSVALLNEKKEKPTVYTDAWAESAKRMQTPESDDLEEGGSGKDDKPMG